MEQSLIRIEQLLKKIAAGVYNELLLRTVLTLRRDTIF